MKYSYVLRNDDRVLRPVTLEDAEFIVKLRNQAHAKGCINDTSIDVEKQCQWISEYLKRENEYYWIAEDLAGKPYGTTSLYHYNAEHRQIESGRWVRMVDAPETNLLAGRVQMHDFVFRTLGMSRLVFDVVSTNKPVIKYNRMCGSIETGREKDAVVIQGKPVDVIWFEETPESWARNRPHICRLAGLPEDLEEYGTVERIMV